MAAIGNVEYNVTKFMALRPAQPFEVTGEALFFPASILCAHVLLSEKKFTQSWEDTGMSTVKTMFISYWPVNV